MKRRSTILLALVLTFSLLPGRATAAAVKSTPLTLIYGNDVRGELAPCG